MFSFKTKNVNGYFVLLFLFFILFFLSVIGGEDIIIYFLVLVPFINLLEPKRIPIIVFLAVTTSIKIVVFYTGLFDFDYFYADGEGYFKSGYSYLKEVPYTVFFEYDFYKKNTFSYLSVGFFLSSCRVHYFIWLF